MEGRGSGGMRDVVMRGIRGGTSRRILDIGSGTIGIREIRGESLSEVEGRDGKGVEGEMSEIEVVLPFVAESVLNDPTCCHLYRQTKRAKSETERAKT